MAHKTETSNRSVIVLGLTLALVASLGFNFYQATSDNGDSRYPLLAKRLFVENPNDIIINFTTLRNESRSYVGAQDEKIGFYFEYLPTGATIGINEKEAFFRASLVKLPGIMRTVKLIEEGKLKKSDQLEVKKENLNPLFGTLGKQPPGKKYSVEDLIGYALRESDNTAYEVLNDKVNGEILKDKPNEKSIVEVYNYLDIPTSSGGETIGISPKSFGSILKSLYFSSYLSYENSNWVLRLLTESTFKDLLPASVPTGTLIAHKFGLYQLEPKELQVHSDCGIVYVPKRPYLLCVMVNSPDQVESTKHITALGKLVFEQVTQANK